MEDWYWPLAIDGREAAWIARVMEENGLHVHLNTVVDEFVGDAAGAVTGMRTKVAGSGHRPNAFPDDTWDDGPGIECDIAVITIGVVPTPGGSVTRVSSSTSALGASPSTGGLRPRPPACSPPAAPRSPGSTAAAGRSSCGTPRAPRAGWPASPCWETPPPTSAGRSTIRRSSWMSSTPPPGWSTSTSRGRGTGSTRRPDRCAAPRGSSCRTTASSASTCWAAAGTTPSWCAGSRSAATCATCCPTCGRPCSTRS